MAKKVTKRWRQEWTQPLPGIGGEVRARRQRLGLTYGQLADAMGIHWTTLRNWELGKGGRQRNPQKTRLVRRFLSGEYDEILQKKKEERDFAGDERELLQLCLCFYHLHWYHEMLSCLEKTERWGEFQERVEEIVRRNAMGEKRTPDSLQKSR
ncbi:MAG: helix-turn-helix domain-containing protein [Lentisphaeria bacterium]|nr:helix-turn-helix domain-containing protein [Lentisphaeria bacterium]